MFKVLCESVGLFCGERLENSDNFSNNGNVSYTETGRLIGRVVGIVLSIVITLLIGKYLWNNAAVKLVGGLKPVKNIFELLGLMLLIGLLFP